ncbi:ParA family protein [Streptomyces sp. NPDC056713]|uniref:ParA family protein n=1 Tax=Streptomyces sp. NPDC056713 TaxID=3345921 RepID=UPI0036905809
MTSPQSGESTDKLIVNLTPELRRDLKIRAAEHGLNVTDATAHALSLWYEKPDAAAVEVKGAKSWGTYLPSGGAARFADECERRGVAKTQGIAQAVTLWLFHQPSPAKRLVSQPVRRILVAIQKGGVGKTFISAGLAQAFAELGLRVLLIDYDPQGHLTRRLGQKLIPMDSGVSLLEHMLGKARKHIRRSIVVMPQKRFGERLHLLPACNDAFLFDAVMSSMRTGREESLARALEPVEKDYDVIVLDGPPSLGLAMDIAMHYSQRREGELADRSGLLMPVWPDTPSFEAYDLFNGQRLQLMEMTRVQVDELGFVVNTYDGRRGASVQKKKEEWEERANPGVLHVFGDLKEQRDATDHHTPLLEWAPDCDLSNGLRSMARELAA